MRKPLLLLALLAVAGCGDVAPDQRGPRAAQNKAAPAAEAGTAYRCEDGSSVRVRFDRQSGGAAVTLADGTSATLAEGFDEQGLVYRDERTEMRIAGAAITIGPRGGAQRTCRV